MDVSQLKPKKRSQTENQIKWDLTTFVLRMIDTKHAELSF